MSWFDSLLGDGNDDNNIGRARDGGAGPSNGRSSRDPLGRVPADPVFDAFRSAWKAGAGLLELFGDGWAKISNAVGPEEPSRRPDVAKVETFLDRTGHLDLARTDGSTGYFGRRVEKGIRDFQRDGGLKVDGLINPGGPTLRSLGVRLFEEGAADMQNKSHPLPPRGHEHSNSLLAVAAGPVTVTESEPPRLTPFMDQVEKNYRKKVDGLRRRGMPVAAANLEHFLDGSGEPRELPRAEAIKLAPIRDAEATNTKRFVTKTFRGLTEKNDDVRKLASMRDGEEFAFRDKWNRDIEFGDYLWNSAFGVR